MRFTALFLSIVMPLSWQGRLTILVLIGGSIAMARSECGRKCEIIITEKLFMQSLFAVRIQEKHICWQAGYDLDLYEADEESIGSAIPLLIDGIGHTTRYLQVGLAEYICKRTISKWPILVYALKQTISALKIQDSKPLSTTLQLINGTPSPIGWYYDPVAVIRAVNHLRAIGKEKTIAAMREYLTIARGPDFGAHRPPDPNNIETSNQWCLALLIPLVFESTNSAHPFPAKIDRVTLEDDIPFHNVYIKRTSSSPQRTDSLVDWAEKYGKIISKQLRPSDHPLDAADRIYQKLLKADPTDSNSGLKEHLRSQAWRAIRLLVEPEDKHDYRVKDEKFSDHMWNRFKEKANRLKIRWNEQKQEYTIDAN